MSAHTQVTLVVFTLVTKIILKKKDDFGSVTMFSFSWKGRQHIIRMTSLATLFYKLRSQRKM